MAQVWQAAGDGRQDARGARGQGAAADDHGREDE